ncbi:MULTISPECIES: toll/interleukin-1 receptor domain-containing protein [Sorangium]|uniref:toll/interleukin-1 receptor domain-containing protein n=1 Tax=Sorangium TaxID=39643 RepID=UPI003D9C033F
MTNSPQRIFISYSWSSQAHQAAVIELAEKLVSDGIDVILDVWEVKEGHDLISFMEKMVTDASVQKVLLICDRVYAQKANDRKGGVGTESQIISPEVYGKVDQSKFIPVLFERDDDGKDCLPVFLKSRMYIDFSSIEKKYENYEQLLRAIYNQPLHKKPKLGSPPSHLFTAPAAHPSTRYHFERARDALVSDKPHAFALARDYLRRKIEELESYRMTITPRADYDDTIVDSIKSMLPYRDEIIDFLTVLVEYRNEPQSYEEVCDFFQSMLAYHFRPTNAVNWTNVTADNFKFVSYELFLYFVAVLLRAKRFAETSAFLDRDFYVVNNEGSDRFWRFVEIRPYLDSLDEHRRQRLKLNRVSITADILKERATRTDVGFAELGETDLMLYLRSYLTRPQGQAGRVWYPYTAIYRGPDGGAPKLLRMSESRKYFDNLKMVLGVDPSETGQSLQQRYLQNGGKPELTFNSASWPISIMEIVNFDRLGTRP